MPIPLLPTNVGKNEVRHLWHRVHNAVSPVSNKKYLPQKLEIHRRLRTSNQHLGFCFLGGKNVIKLVFIRTNFIDVKWRTKSWPQTHRKQPASDLRVLRLKACSTGPKNFNVKPNTETNKRKHTHRTQQDIDLEKHFLNRAKFAQEFEPASDKWIYTKLKPS